MVKTIHNQRKMRNLKLGEIEIRYDYSPSVSKNIRGEFVGFTNISESMDLISVLLKSKKEIIYVPITAVRYFKIPAIKNKLSSECDVSYA